MFKLNTERLVWWPVRVTLSLDDGKTETHEFSARFQLLGRKEVNEISRKRGLDGLLRRVLVEWKDVSIDVPGGDIDNDGVRELLINDTAVRLALVTAYTEASGGARVKN
jgi:hypothetical protein